MISWKQSVQHSEECFSESLSFAECCPVDLSSVTDCTPDRTSMDEREIRKFSHRDAASIDFSAVKSQLSVSLR